MTAKKSYLVVSGQIDAEVECESEGEAMEEVRKARKQGHANILVLTTNAKIRRLHTVEVLWEVGEGGK